MSSRSLLGLPPVSPALKPIVPFLQRANELQTQDSVMTYWCAYHAAQLGIHLKANDTASRNVLVALLGFLEQLKKEIGPSDALHIDSVSSAYVENFALKVFSLADNDDRSGSATRATAKKFLAAAHFLEVLKVFSKADISESTEEKIKYAKWKAADISKAFREGRKPTPGPAGSSVVEDLEATHSDNASPPSNIKDVQINIDGHQSSIAIEHSSATFDEITQVPSAPLPHTLPRFAGPYLDVTSFEHRGRPFGESIGEATPGSRSTAATPGIAQGREEQAYATRGASTQRPGIPKRKPWVSEELEGKDESEYLGLSVEMERPIVGNDNSAPVIPAEPVPTELSDSAASSSAPSSPYEAHTSPYIVERHLDWAMDELAHPPTQQPLVSNPFPGGFVPSSQPTGIMDSSHLEHVSSLTGPSIEIRPESLPPHQYALPTPPPVLSRQHWSPPPPIAGELTPSIIAKAQKHCRFAISALDYEDAEQARKELRAALAILGDT